MAIRLARVLGCVEGFARQVNDCLGVGVVSVGLCQPSEFDRLDDVDELLRSADAGVGLRIVAAACVEAGSR